MATKSQPPARAPAPAMTVAEAARALGITLDAVWRLLRAGKLAGKKDPVTGEWQVERKAVAERKAKEDGDGKAD